MRLVTYSREGSGLRRIIGELSFETIAVAALSLGHRAATTEARAGGYGTVISHRSGKTRDDFIADFAVATAAGDQDPARRAAAGACQSTTSSPESRRSSDARPTSRNASLPDIGAVSRE